MFIFSFCALIWLRSANHAINECRIVLYRVGLLLLTAFQMQSLSQFRQLPVCLLFTFKEGVAFWLL